MCGSFQVAGDVAVNTTLAKYSNGVWEEIDARGYIVTALYGYESQLFYSFQAGYDSYLNMVGIDTLTGEEIFAQVPKHLAGGDSPSAFYVYENYVFVGGSFEVLLADGTVTSCCNSFFSSLCYYFIIS